MVKISKVVVFGAAGVGKTALLEQLIYGTHTVGSPMFSTIEDTYVASIETDRGQRERVRFYDTAGWTIGQPDVPKQYLSFADAYVLVYDVTNIQTFKDMDKMKKEIDKLKEKKEAAIISIGTKCDFKDNKAVDFNTANKWAQAEKVRLWEVSVVNRVSLFDAFCWLTSKITATPNKSGFGLMSKKTKSNVSDA